MLPLFNLENVFVLWFFVSFCICVFAMRFDSVSRFIYKQITTGVKLRRSHAQIVQACLGLTLCVSRFLACEGCGRRLDESFPTWAFLSFCKWISACVQQLHFSRPRISPQWLSELRRLWSSVPGLVACDLVCLFGWFVPCFLLMGFHTMPGQYSQFWFQTSFIYLSALLKRL